MFGLKRVALALLILALTIGGMGAATRPAQASGRAGDLYPLSTAGVRTWSFTVTHVVKDTTVAIQSYNFPSNVWFKVKIGRYTGGGYDWQNLPDLDTGNGGSASYTFDIPAGFSGAGQLVLRLVQTKKNGRSFSQDQVFYNVTGSGAGVQPAAGPYYPSGFGPVPPGYPSFPGSNWRLVMADRLESGFWDERTGRTMSLNYTMGGYLITNDSPGAVVWSARSDTYNGVRVDVAAQRIAGPMDGYYGVVCNFADGANYYILALGVNGWFGIGLKTAKGSLAFLTEGWDTTLVGTGGAMNVLRAECIPGSLTLWANGRQLASVTDFTFSGGAVGLAVGNRSTGGTQVLFKNFAVFVPGN